MRNDFADLDRIRNELRYWRVDQFPIDTVVMDVFLAVFEQDTNEDGGIDLPLYASLQNDLREAVSRYMREAHELAGTTVFEYAARQRTAEALAALVFEAFRYGLYLGLIPEDVIVGYHTVLRARREKRRA